MRSAFGSIDKRDGRYRVRWSENGKSRCKSFHNINDASTYLAQMQIMRGNVDTNITFNDYYTSAVRPSMSRLSKRTKYEYENTWKRIKPIIGKIAIAKCNRRIVQNVIDSFDSPGAQRQAFVLMRKICNLAIADDIILKNPVTRHVQRDKEIRQPKTLYTAKGLVRALKEADQTEFALPLLFCCCGGMRPEEAFAVNKRDIDFHDSGYAFINVDKALTIVGGKKHLKEPKTSTSHRLVALNGGLVDYLLKNKDRIKNYRTLKEYPVSYNISKRWRKRCFENNEDYVKFGDMRSVYATLAAEAGCLDSVVCQAMGHSGRNMKERNYQSLTLKAMMANAKCFSAYIGMGDVERSDDLDIAL